MKGRDVSIDFFTKKGTLKPQPVKQSADLKLADGIFYKLDPIETINVAPLFG